MPKKLFIITIRDYDWDGGAIRNWKNLKFSNTENGFDTCSFDWPVDPKKNRIFNLGLNNVVKVYDRRGYLVWEGYVEGWSPAGDHISVNCMGFWTATADKTCFGTIASQLAHLQLSALANLGSVNFIPRLSGTFHLTPSAYTAPAYVTDGKLAQQVITDICALGTNNANFYYVPSVWEDRILTTRSYYRLNAPRYIILNREYQAQARYSLASTKNYGTYKYVDSVSGTKTATALLTDGTGISMKHLLPLLPQKYREPQASDVSGVAPYTNYPKDYYYDITGQGTLTAANATAWAQRDGYKQGMQAVGQLQLYPSCRILDDLGKGAGGAEPYALRAGEFIRLPSVTNEAWQGLKAAQGFDDRKIYIKRVDVDGETGAVALTPDQSFALSLMVS